MWKVTRSLENGNEIKISKQEEVGTRLSLYGLSNHVDSMTAHWEDVTTQEAARLRELYTSAGQYYATGLLAVVFGQFTVLALLAGKVKGLGYLGAEWGLVIIYVLIVSVGAYFVYRAAFFAQLEEGALRRSDLGDLDTRIRVSTGNTYVDQARLWLIRRPLALVFIYATFSALALAWSLLLD